MISQNNGSIQARALTEGAILAAVSALLGMMGVYLPVLGIITNLVWAIPIILLVIRHDLRVGVMGLLVSGFLMSVLVGPVQGFLLTLNLGGMALAYGYCFKNRLSPMKALLLGTVIAAISSAATLILSSYIASLPVMSIIGEIKEAIDQAFKLYQQMGVPWEKILPPGMTVEQYKDQMYHTIQTLLPGAFVAVSMGSAFVNYLVAQKVLLRLHYQVPEMPLFREWRVPNLVIWVVIIGLDCMLGGRYFHIEWVEVIGQNILYVSSPLLLISGSALLVFYWKNKALTSLTKAMIIFGAVIFSNIFFMLLILLGFLDPIFDYRRFIRQKEQM